MLVTVKGVAPLVGIGLWYAAQVEPQLQYGEQPRRAPLQTVMSNVRGEVTFDLTDNQEYVAIWGPGQFKRVMYGFTRQVPRLDSLVPDTMASGSGDHVLEVHGRGLSISNELYFGAQGHREPVRPKDQKIITTGIKTDLWAPGEQPVWVVNAGIKSNVLTFTFT